MSDPQFVVGGPRIPSEIIRALEEERLMFFCGAGISIGTGLPDFRNLALEAIRYIDGAPGNLPADPAVRDAYCLGLYDKALNILEDREGHRGDLRRFVARRLTRRLRNRREQLRLHRALLDLSRLSPSNNGERGYRLVTTNYDDRFERAGLPRRWMEAAPRLARPQAARVGYATFLHGRIETESAKRDPEHTSLILTSADFGDAYLRDGYAARFVLELFREFTVLFIGYSLNDPVMRYLMDIFATESQFRQAYSFVAHGDDDADRQRQLWGAKHVVPVLYNNARGHHILTETLETWSGAHRAGSNGRFQVLIDAVTKPYQGDVDADNLANAAWALSDREHRVARRLGSVNPKEGDLDADISWFGPLLDATVVNPLDDKRKCRLVEIDHVAFQLSRWAMRHLTRRELVAWAISNEHALLNHLRRPFFLLLIDATHNANSVIDDPFRLFWELLIEIAATHNELRESDMTWRLRSVKASPDTLASIVHRLQPRLRWPAEPSYTFAKMDDDPIRLQDLARYEISDRVGHWNHYRFRNVFGEILDNEREPKGDLSSLADDLTNLLVGICRLGTRIGASFATGSSRFSRESITPDPRNQLELDSWEWLIEAVVQAFEAARCEGRDVAIAIGQRWSMLWQAENQSLFGRLYLYSVARLQELTPNDAIRTCCTRPDVLWIYEYEPELLALLRIRGAEIGEHSLDLLIAHLLAEPPPEQVGRRDIDHERGRRFAKLLAAGVELKVEGRAIAERYLAQHLSPADPRDDEVAYHVVQGGWVAPPSGKDLVGLPINEIVTLVGRGHDEYGFPHDAWGKAKRTADWLRQEPARIGEVFETLALRNEAPNAFVNGVFWVLRDVTTQPEVIQEIDRIAAALLACPALIDGSYDACSSWIKALATADIPDESFWPVWDLIETRAPKDDVASGEDMSLTAAINAPGGYLTEALLDRLWKSAQKPGQGLPLQIQERLTRLVSGDSRLVSHARLVCMPPLHGLYAIDPDWTREVLLLRLRWENQPYNPEVAALWSTHLEYGQWSLDLMAALRAHFLACLGKREALDESAYRSACWRFTALGVDRPDFLSDAEIRDGFRRMGADGAAFVLAFFETRLRQSDQPANLWRDIFGPWLLKHWPRQEALRTVAVFSAASEMLLETGEAFAEALGTLENLHLVGAMDENRLLLFRLERVQDEERQAYPLLGRFPADICRWLDQTLPTNVPQHERRHLLAVVEIIRQQLPDGSPDPICLVHLRERLH